MCVVAQTETDDGAEFFVYSPNDEDGKSERGNDEREKNCKKRSTARSSGVRGPQAWISSLW